MINMPISELVYINDAAKVLKQKDFLLYNTTLIGIDNLKVSICKLQLDPSYIQTPIFSGLIFNQRELAKYIKNITTESSIEIDENQRYTIIPSLIDLETSITIEINNIITNDVLSKLSKVNMLDNTFSYEEDVTTDLSKLFNMRKDDGGFYYVYKNKYFMTLFNGLLPLNKSDKVFISLQDDPNYPSIFHVRFRIKKTKFEVFVYLTYTNIIGGTNG